MVGPPANSEQRNTWRLITATTKRRLISIKKKIWRKQETRNLNSISVQFTNQIAGLKFPSPKMHPEAQPSITGRPASYSRSRRRRWPASRRGDFELPRVGPGRRKAIIRWLLWAEFGPGAHMRTPPPPRAPRVRGLYKD